MITSPTPENMFELHDYVQNELHAKNRNRNSSLNKD